MNCVLDGGAYGYDSRAVERDTLQEGDWPYVEIARLAAAEVEKSGGKFGFPEATRFVMRRDPELAERYRRMPGTT